MYCRSYMTRRRGYAGDLEAVARDMRVIGTYETAPSPPCVSLCVQPLRGVASIMNALPSAFARTSDMLV